MSYYHIGRVLTCTTILSKSVLVCVIGYLKVAVWGVCILKNRVCKSAELFVASLKLK